MMTTQATTLTTRKMMTSFRSLAFFWSKFCDQIKPMLRSRYTLRSGREGESETRTCRSVVMTVLRGWKRSSVVATTDWYAGAELFTCDEGRDGSGRH